MMPSWMAGTLLAAFLLVAAGGLRVLQERTSLRRTLKNLNRMLDAAIDGTFTQEQYDESLLSALENRLAVYLSASAVSAKNLAGEKERIQSLLGDISHQTKTPLSNILLYGELLAEQSLPENSLATVRTLNQQAEKLRFLIDSLVKLSRLETGILRLHPVGAPILPLLTAALDPYRASASAQGIRLRLVLPKSDLPSQGQAPSAPSETMPPQETGLPPKRPDKQGEQKTQNRPEPPAPLDLPDIQAVFDPKWTLEALQNLLDNAVKYSPAGGLIEVRVCPYDLFCRIDIQDTGIGIEESQQEKIFGRFYRSPAVSQQEGVGIGLYLTRRILTEQGGYLKVRSVLGQGSTFSIFLPRDSM